MISNITRLGALGLALLALAACDDTPTEPASAVSALPEAELAAVAAANSWGTRANMPSDRYTPDLATVKNAQGQTVLYAIGGTTRPFGTVPLGTVQAYNSATNSWTNRAPVPIPVYATNGAGVINGKIYVSGGSTSDRVEGFLFMYNPATNRWTRKKDLPYAGTNGVTGVYQNKLYVLAECSGRATDGSTGNEPGCPTGVGRGMYRYDPVTNAWTFLSGAPRDHYAGQGGFIGGRFYLTGGVNSGRTLSVFDPATNTWSTRAPMPAGRNHAAYATIAAKLYLAGGIEEDLNNNGWTFHSKSVIRYDPATDRWTTLTPMPSVRDGISGGWVVVNGQQRFEVVGGARPGNNLQYTP